MNDEVQKKQLYDPLVNNTLSSTDSATYVRCRDEEDLFGDDIYQLAPKWHIYWTALSALHFGIDIWANNGIGIKDTADDKFAYDFFTRYAGKKNPRYSPAAFCALRDGLDAANTDRFSTKSPSNGGFGSGTEDANDVQGENRCIRIAGAYAAYGASQDDPPHAQGGAVNQFRATGLNDVGWNIFPGNYERYIHQYINKNDSTKNGAGYWRVGSTNQSYGRFAKGFNHSALQDSLFFDIDDNFFAGLTAPISCSLHIVYYDTGRGSWKINYDATSGKNKSVSFTNTGSSTWKDVYINISDGNFANRESHNSDFTLINTDNRNEIFHLVEIIKNSP